MLTSFLITMLVTALSLLILSRMNLGLEIKDTGTAIVAALVLGLLNATLRPVLGFLAFPITLLTLGLFAIVLNALVLYIAAALVEGFRLRGFLSAVVISILLGLLNWLIFLIIPGR
jgi:putative membrane protein